MDEGDDWNSGSAGGDDEDWGDGSTGDGNGEGGGGGSGEVDDWGDEVKASSGGGGGAGGPGGPSGSSGNKGAADGDGDWGELEDEHGGRGELDTSWEKVGPKVCARHGLAIVLLYDDADADDAVVLAAVCSG